MECQWPVKNPSSLFMIPVYELISSRVGRFRLHRLGRWFQRRFRLLPVSHLKFRLCWIALESRIAQYRRWIFIHLARVGWLAVIEGYQEDWLWASKLLPKLWCPAQRCRVVVSLPRTRRIVLELPDLGLALGYP